MTDHRLARAQRLAAKRPASTPRIVVTHEPSPIAKDRLAELLLELLDERARSGGR